MSGFYRILAFVLLLASILWNYWGYPEEASYALLGGIFWLLWGHTERKETQ